MTFRNSRYLGIMPRTNGEVRGQSGVYVIYNSAAGGLYVGSSINLYTRWSVHQSDLRRGKHGNVHLQNAWNKYGGKKFQFSILETVKDKSILREREQYWMDTLKPKYNICPVADYGMQIGEKSVLWKDAQ